MKRFVSWCLTLLMLVSVVVLADDPGKVTIAQIHQSHPVSILEWVKAFLGIGTGNQMSVELQILILAFFMVPFCQIGSFWFKWSSKMIERQTSMIDYFYRQDPQRTAYAFIAAMITIGTGCFTSAFSTDAGDFVGWYNVLYNVIIVGTGGDLLINKSKSTS